MPHTDRESDLAGERPSERRRKSKSEKDPNRPHKSRSSRPRLIDPETGEPVRSERRKKRDKEKEESTTSLPMEDGVPELSRTASLPGSSSRSSLPYPSFSKAHSKEAVSANARVNVYTPDATDLGAGGSASIRHRSMDNLDAVKGMHAQTDTRPPSPPETEFSQQRKSTSTRMSQVQEEEELESRPRSKSSVTSLKKERDRDRNREQDKDDRSRVSRTSKASTAVKSSKRTATVVTANEGEHSANEVDPDAATEVGGRSAVDSNATSVAPSRVPTASSRRPVRTPLDTDSSPASAQDSSPRTPTQTPGFSATPAFDIKPTPSPFLHFDAPASNLGKYTSPMPPPPPPVPTMPINIPRVDYLMQNGGLPRPVSKTLLGSSTASISPSQYPSRTPAPIAAEMEKIFGPYYHLLDQYESVIHKNGSLAVATGYRSVARRLLDRLEAVFARDLSSESCYCVMCSQNDDQYQHNRKGLGWGEVLEWVCGRRELPAWPAFDFGSIGIKATEDFSGILRPDSVINMDPDIAEEFREHYLRQTKKTKASVDRWLSTCAETAAPPPENVDDETLTFAILTHIGPRERPLFNALLAGSSQPLQSSSRAPSRTGEKPRSDFIVRTGHSLQRLYRLPVAPRDPEAAIYLLHNPLLHNLLATLSGINTSEWEILTSGRFDGFLWSGAESELHSMNNSPSVSRGPTPANGLPSRGPTPNSYADNRVPGGSRTTSPFTQGGVQYQNLNSAFSSRNTTPFSSANARGPVSNDEETEIAVLAEIEREIYQGMEALEDAFESLHRKAEIVRRALRERGAGLSMRSQSRHPDILLSSTPGAGEREKGYGGRGYSGGAGGDVESEGGDGQSESDDWAGGAESEIAPDDSASNISSSRHRRPKRRNERRTPAPVEEEDED